MPKDGKARGEQVLIFRVLAWDANCPKHIPQRFDAVDVAHALEQRNQRIAELEEEIARLVNARGLTYGQLGKRPVAAGSATSVTDE